LAATALAATGIGRVHVTEDLVDCRLLDTAHDLELDAGVVVADEHQSGVRRVSVLLASNAPATAEPERDRTRRQRTLLHERPPRIVCLFCVVFLWHSSLLAPVRAVLGGSG
jgi:hypothetical protein